MSGIAICRSLGEKDLGDRFGLTHDKINGGNVMFTPSGEVRFLDLTSLFFGTPAKDLVAAIYYFCAKEQEGLYIT